MAGSWVKFENNLPQVQAALEATMAQRMMSVGIHMTNATKQTLTGSRSGRIYKVPGTTWSHSTTVGNEKYTLKRERSGNYSLSMKRGGQRYQLAQYTDWSQARADFGQYRRLSTKTSGRYRVARKTHQASAPGEPPAVLYGFLRNSIRWVIEGTGMRLRVLIGSSLQKSAWLEMGTSKMAPRPFLRPTFIKEKEACKKILSNIWLPGRGRR